MDRSKDDIFTREGSNSHDHAVVPPKQTVPPSTQRTIAVDEIIAYDVIDMFGKVSRSSVASARRVTVNIVISHDARFDLIGSGSNTSSKLQDVSLRKSTDEDGSVACS